jgi:hypothetical protein
MKTALKIFIIIVWGIFNFSAANAQDNTHFNLVKLFKNKKLTVYNRQVKLKTDASKDCIELSEEEGEGLVWINGVSFSTGTIDIDLKGRDMYQHSFLGIAFHGLSDSTFEAIYFRPFQFGTSDSTRMMRAIQYISLPLYTWQKLREQHYGVYENSVYPVPGPDDWFHVKIVVKENEALTYVNDSATPSLKINLLGEIKSGKIALYTADRSGGTFANLSVKSD